MKIAVLGTGMAGRALAGRFTELGHEVTMGTRDPESSLARAQPDRMGIPPLSAWLAEHPLVTLASFADAAGRSEFVVNATNGAASLGALASAGEAALSGKVLLDVANPLDFSHGLPPTLFVSNTDSLAEQIQRAFPAARVVKSLNTMTAALQANPARLADGDHSVFVSGNDDEAKTTVIDLLASLGHTDVIDLGDISTARGAEMLMPVWLRLRGALGTGLFNYKIVR